MPTRPRRPLNTIRLARVALSSTLAALDEELFDELCVERRYIWGRLFVISDPDGIRRVMQDNVENYPRIEPIRRVFGFTAGTGMLAAEGEVWRRHRRLLNPALDHRAVIADVPMMVEMAERLAAEVAAVPAGEAIDLGNTFAHAITAMTGRIFAADCRDIDAVVYRLGQYPGRYGIVDFLPPLGILERWQNRSAEIAPFLPVIDRLLAERRSADYAGPHDLLWRMAAARDRDSGEELSPAELRDEALTLGATAATPLRVFPWLWYLLATHPAVEARLDAELADVLGGRSPEAEDFARLPYLRRVIDEVLRLYPPAPTMLRTALADDFVCGRRLRRGTIVAVLPWVVHRHRRLWHDPDRFDPDRYLPEQVAARPRYAYLPFAVGPHVCIGASLALVEILVTAAIFAQRFRFRPIPGRAIEPIAWTNLHPRGGIKATVEPRPAAC